MNHNDKLDAIESIMDSCTNCAEFLELVAEVCSAKADHLRDHWQDELGAEIFDLRAAALLNISPSIEDYYA